MQEAGNRLKEADLFSLQGGVLNNGVMLCTEAYMIIHNHTNEVWLIGLMACCLQGLRKGSGMIKVY